MKIKKRNFITLLVKSIRFCCYGFLPVVVEAVLEAARQKMDAALYLNRSPLNIDYSFYFFDRFNAPIKFEHICENVIG